ncbi:MAG: hypothetical protein OM95_01905 [Bdellovibrio sp. ArHS]|uniref:hypothetical protein n=1 Tax=Bdellovibrio sp. ArHS TaxID=1569284 RepID=UPI000583175B|nr:hypothetical protein [Bdellovibrio sp. ArHS]KHD89912.1 MAG: hypothetical protein OM95_01905 [Bdellovibrio sp. ArHS]
MSKKKKKSSAAENLIESLMDDLKDIQSDSSYHSESSDGEFSGLPTLDDEAHRVEKTNAGNNLWDNLEKGLEQDLDASEFTGGAEASEEDVPVEDFDMPEGFGDLPPSERFMVNSAPIAEEERYQGPSSDGGYQSSDDLFSPPTPDFSSQDSVDESTRPVFSGQPGGGEDKTVSIQQDFNATSSVASSNSDADKTVAVDGFANARLGARKSADVDVKVSVGNFRGSRGSANVMTSVDASLAQAENLKLAQQRILELEREVEHLRADNEELASAGEIIRTRTDELTVRITSLEKEKTEIQESAQSEILILKGNLQFKENEVAKARIKVEELETRLKSDFKKIRVRERELENRLELLRAEKSALVRSKDEYILEQKRKIDQLSQELDNYRKKCLELNKTIEANQDQVKRTERALRLALTNLEAKEESAVPLKKAE